MQIESLPISTLSPDPANARRHPRQNLDAIKASLDRFGQQKPIVIDAASRVIAGHGTLAAAQALGWTKINAVRSHLPPADAKAYALADNRAADLSEWDLPRLAQQLASLQNNQDIDHLATGFSDNDIEQIINQATGLTPASTDKDSSESNVPRPEELPPIHQVLATCDDEPAQRQLYDQLTAQGHPCRLLTL